MPPHTRHGHDRPVNSACRYCHGPILWTGTAAGGRMPVDPVPNPAGNVLLDQLIAHVLGPASAATSRHRGDRLYMPHAATCTARGTRQAG